MKVLLIVVVFLKTQYAFVFPDLIILILIHIWFSSRRLDKTISIHGYSFNSCSQKLHIFRYDQIKCIIITLLFFFRNKCHSYKNRSKRLICVLNTRGYTFHMNTLQFNGDSIYNFKVHLKTYETVWQLIQRYYNSISPNLK